jgi:hypothetical protein
MRPILGNTHCHLSLLSGVVGSRICSQSANKKLAEYKKKIKKKHTKGSRQTRLEPRECHGQPWGFPGKPAPVPAETLTRGCGCGFLRVRVWVLWNPRVTTTSHGILVCYIIIIWHITHLDNLPQRLQQRQHGYNTPATATGEERGWKKEWEGCW